MANPKTRVIIFEDFPKWCIEFDRISYMIVKDSDVVETSHTIDMENYFLRHERDYSVLKGREIKEALTENKDLIFVSEIRDIERQAFFIYSIINHFYRRNYLRAYKNYNKHEKIIFIIEEAQNTFDSSVISKKLFNRLRKIFSVARNLDLHFVLASQRLQDLNTRIRGRTRLLIGRIDIDDYQLKIRRLLRHSQFKIEVLNLKVGEFIYPALDRIIRFPKFQQNDIPYQYKPKPTIKAPQPKPSFWQKLLGIKPQPKREPVETEEAEDEELNVALIPEDEDEESETLFW